MRNRAKCKLCESIIESYHYLDFVVCKCGEISVDGAEAMRCAAKNWNNFLRVDDEGNEIKVTVKDGPNILTEIQENEIVKQKWNDGKEEHRKMILDSIAHLVTTIEGLPIAAQSSPVTQSDLASILSLLLSLFRIG